MQYFTGSKAHNVALRQRALKMGYTLSEYSLARLDNEKAVAGKIIVFLGDVHLRVCRQNRTPQAGDKD